MLFLDFGPETLFCSKLLDVLGFVWPEGIWELQFVGFAALQAIGDLQVAKLIDKSY